MNMEGGFVEHGKLACAHGSREPKRIHTSYIASIKMFSNRDRKPLAPVFLPIAFLAISLNASLVKCSLTWEAKRSKIEIQIHLSDCKYLVPGINLA